MSISERGAIILFDTVKPFEYFYSILFYSILFYSILFYSILFFIFTYYNTRQDRGEGGEGRLNFSFRKAELPLRLCRVH